jgi:hypothetical protein
LSSCGQRYASSYQDFIVSIFTESIGWQQEDEPPVFETVWPVGGNLRRNRALRDRNSSRRQRAAQHDYRGYCKRSASGTAAKRTA